MKTGGVSGAGYREIAQTLRESIQAGELAPGAALPPESEVCRRWAVSRVTARRALAALEADGLIESVAGRGRFVKVTDQGQARIASRAEVIAAEIQADIQSGRLAAGMRVDSEASLSRRYGVARGTSRQALLILDRGGLTTTIPGRGRFVASPDRIDNRAEEVARSIEAEIRAGNFPANTKLPGEKMLADRYRVARSTTRRALDILEVNGLIARLPGKPRLVLPTRTNPGG
ncbi:GntR family transcriptional regulator [Salinispora arenicola]|uniref:GntR family transcriptional regulator n=1 Tax=Salinispora arenicola TaxID=168697 RepID=UPI00207991A8|nr:GntR family transcriptional regulator [Salinispora arenicola]MCN0152568.1 GntR family transcriptional regulator [Salinispora arenicola]